MSLRIAINGFGRIGRKVYRLLSERADCEVVAINDLSDAQTLALLLRRDSVHLGMGLEAAITEDSFEVDAASGTWKTRVLHEPKPAELPWRELGVDAVIEATGRFRTRETLQMHLTAGAGRVLLTAPAKGELDRTVVYGVNHDELSASDRIISAASCTTNCLAPLVKVLDARLGVERGLMTTIHAYTNDQALLDSPHKDPRRARAAALNIVPTTTGAAEAVALVYPAIAGKLHGIACRVPVASGSLVDLTFETREPLSVQGINEVVRAAAETELGGVLCYSEEPLVSQDVIGDSHSCVFDSLMTSVQGERLGKVLAWYDNEWGYSCRVCDVLQHWTRSDHGGAGEDS